MSLANSLLDSVSVSGRIVTGDALYCQRRLCERTVSAGGDYLMLVKGNQRSLCEDVEFCFSGADASGADCGTYRYAETVNGHGDRLERRRLWATDMLEGYLDWPGHKQVIKMESRRLVKDKETIQVRYAITSLGTETSAGRLLRLMRGHWSIENRLHYVRDFTMGEDGSQVRVKSAPQVMAALRNLVLNIFRLSGKVNIAAAIRNIGWRPNGALELLGLTPSQ